MANRWTRRPLTLEALEPRVYLSAGARENPAARSLAPDQLRALVNQLFPSGLARTAEVQAIEIAGSTNSALVVDVNGNADTSDALLATFNPNTGELLNSIPLAGGQFVLVADQSVHSAGVDSTNGSETGDLPQSSFNLGVVSRPIIARTPPLSGSSEAETTGASRVPTGSAQSSAATRADSSTPASLENDYVPDGNAKSVQTSQGSAADSGSASPPVVVVFPTGTIPENFNVRASAQQAGTRGPGENRDTARPLILSPIFPQWLTELGPSPWWSRAVELPGVQSRVGDLFDRGLDDDYFGSQSRLGLGAGPGDPLKSIEFSSSRVMLRSPAHLMVFAAPATHETLSGGAGTELATYNFATGQLTRTGHSVSGRIFAASGQVAFLSSEVEQGSDLSGDGAMNALVLQVFNPVTGGVRNTGVSAERIRSEGGQLILGLRDASKEATASPVPAATGKLWAYRFDPATGRLTNLLRPYDLPTDTAAAANRVDLNPITELPIPDAAFPIAASRVVDPRVSPALLHGQTIAPIDFPATRSSPVASDVSPRSAGGNPAGPPKPGGTSGDDPASSPSVSSPSSTPAPASASAGDGGSGGE